MRLFAYRPEDSDTYVEESKNEEEALQLHPDSCFSCAACGGLRTFPGFEELVQHIYFVHMVTDSEMVRESILLPKSGPGALMVFRCGVCRVTFTAQPEVVLRKHIEAVHGSSYVKLGQGEYLLKFCRICGEERCFTTENELLAHISTCHPPEHFGQRLSDGEEEPEMDEEVNNNYPVQEIETQTPGLMNEVDNRPRNAQEAVKTTPPGPTPKEGQKKRHVDSTSEESYLIDTLPSYSIMDSHCHIDFILDLRLSKLNLCSWTRLVQRYPALHHRALKGFIQNFCNPSR